MNPWEKWSFGTGITEIQSLVTSAVEGVASGDLTEAQQQALKANIVAALKGPSTQPKAPIQFTNLVEQTMDMAMPSWQQGIWQKLIADAQAQPEKAVAPKAMEPNSNYGLAMELVGLVPGLQKKVKGPCQCGATSSEQTVQHWIMHLNDAHMPRQPWQAADAESNPNSPYWSRLRIADWLDTLDVDLYVTEPGQEPWMLALKDAWEQAGLSAIVNGGVVSAHITDKVNNRRVRAQSVAAAEVTIRALVMKNRPFTVWVTRYPERWIIGPEGLIEYQENVGFDRDMEKVTAAAKALAEAMKPLGDQIKMIADAINKAVGSNQQLLDALVEATKKEEAS